MSSHSEQQLKRDRHDRRTAAIGTVVIFASAFALYALLTDLTGWLDPVLFPGWGVILPEMAGAAGELARGLWFSMRQIGRAHV